MSILCVLFGHKSPSYAPGGWFSPGQKYGTLHVRGIDGIGRCHGEVKGTCARCGDSFLLALVHIPDVHKVTRKELSDEITRVRPFADAYHAILRHLEIKSDVIGYINQVTCTKNKLQDALEHLIAEGQRPHGTSPTMGPCECAHCEAYDRAVKLLKEIDKDER